MRISGISNSYNNVKNYGASFNGHFRSIEVEAFQDDVYVARAAGSKTSIEYFLDANNAVYRTIQKAKDFIKNSTIEKINDITVDKADKLGVAEVYYSDAGEKVDKETIKQYADYIVYAPGTKNA